MANFLDALAMSLQGGSNAAAAVQSQDTGEDIRVTGNPLPTRSIPTDNRTVKPTSKKQEQQDETPELIKRKGRFGVGGTLRDILGTVGDAYLISQGRPGTYAPQRQKEKLASAQYGFTDDPNAAAERVGELDADAARDLYKINQTGELARSNQDRQQANLDRQSKKDASAQQYKKIQIAQNMMSASKTPEEQAAVREWLKSPDADVDNLPAHIIAAGGINRYQQEMIPLAQERSQQGQQNADANTLRASRPPQGRATPNPTAASMIAPIADKIKAGKPLTAGEQKVYDDLRPSRGKAKRTVPAIPADLFKK